MRGQGGLPHPLQARTEAEGQAAYPQNEVSPVFVVYFINFERHYFPLIVIILILLFTGLNQQQQTQRVTKKGWNNFFYHKSRLNGMHKD